MRNHRRGGEDPGEPAAVRRAAAAAAPRAGRGRNRHQRASDVPHAQGAGLRARRLPHARHALARRQPRHRALPLPDRRVGIRGQRGAAVLRQLAVRHRPRPQRQPDELRTAQAGDVPQRPAAHQHQLRLRGAAQRARARARARRERAAARSGDGLQRRRERAPARARRLRGGGDDRGLRRARVPRPARHPAARHRLAPTPGSGPSGRSRPRASRSSRSGSRWCATSRRARRS